MPITRIGRASAAAIQTVCDCIRQSTGVDVDPEAIPLDDQGTLDLFRKGQTDGICGFDYKGMKAVLVTLQPDRIEHLIAIQAMYRPGPMVLIAMYSDSKSGKVPAPSVHPMVDPILAETYGVCIYKEQAAQILSRIGGIPQTRGMDVVGSISRYTSPVLKAGIEDFMKGAIGGGLSEADARRVLDFVIEFGPYCCTREYVAEVAILAFRLAYLKLNYPDQFAAAIRPSENDPAGNDGNPGRLSS